MPLSESARPLQHPSRLERRRFLHAAAASLAAAPLLTGGSPLTGTKSTAEAIEPFERPEPGPLKLSLAAYSFRKALTQPADSEGAMTLFDVVDFCRAHRVPGVELTSYYFPEGFGDDYLRSLRRHCHVAGVSISGGAIRNDFCGSAAERQAQLDEVRRWIDAYAVLGAPAIRIFAGQAPQGVSREEAIERCVETTEKAAAHAAEQGIFLALENHGGITDTAESLLKIVRGVDAEWFGVNFDSGNFRLGEDPYAELAAIAPYAVNAQLKVELTEGGKKVPADLPRIVQILRAAGYGGWVALEYEAAEPPQQAVPGYLKELQRLLA
ncbi:sugar phosphate isomerase/epimerase family protein [Candidatus Laterigemmans baculatus]|uniref:sugar phosphate isomerase/epimerase family protein n=1 Tax=Candidatus Laterigemmans baculatus TaxID=2770505 RepID=UPI0013DA5E32|nr:sugar phosphate isomerase/epimerase family protein [Candidatus Laterigemmans baculatus]